MVFPCPGAMFWAAVSALFQLVFAAVLAMSFHVFSSSFWKVSGGDIRVFFSASLWFLHPSLAWCFFPVREPCFGLPCLLAVVFFGNRAGNVVSSSFGKVSRETLGAFSALLCGFSVLHWHRRAPSRRPSDPGPRKHASPEATFLTHFSDDF